MILSKPQLVENIAREISDNSTGQISPHDIRHNLLDIIDSVHLLTGSQNLRARNFDTLDLRSTRAGDLTLQKLGLEGYFSVDNSAFGFSALNANYQGSKNTAIGSYSLSCNIYGEDNAALGYHALAGNTNGFGNIGIGSYSLHNNKIGNFNIAIGHGAGYYVNRDTSNRLFIASHPIDETYLCGNPDGIGLVPLIQGDMSSGNLRVGIAVSGLHDGATLQISGHFHPSDSLQSFDIGHGTYRWRNIYLSQTLSFPNSNYITYDNTGDRFLISNETVIGGPVSISGNTDVSGNLVATGHADFGSYINVGGKLDVNGRIDASGNIKPKVSSAFNLGDFDKRWLNAYVDNIYVSGIGRFKRFEAVEQAHYLHKTVHLASSGYINTIDGGGPNGLYDYYNPNEENVLPVGYLIDEELNGAGFNVRSRGIDYERTYEFIFKSQDAALGNLSVDSPYSRSSWNSNISIHTSSGCHVKTDRIINSDSIAAVTYNDGLGYFIASGKTYSTNEHNLRSDLAGIGNVNFVAHSGEQDKYTITFASPASGVNINQRFLSNVKVKAIDQETDKEKLTGFETSYISDSQLTQPVFFNEQVGQNPSRFVIKSYNNSSYVKRSFTLLQDAADGFVGISNFGHSDNMLPDTILNIRSTGNAIIRATAENQGSTVSALQLLGKENCLKYGSELEYINQSGIFNINIYKNDAKTSFIKVIDSGRSSIFNSNLPHAMITVGDSANNEAVLSLYHCASIPSGYANYAQIFTKSKSDASQASSLNFVDASGNIFEVVMNSIDIGGQNLDKPLLADNSGNTLGGRFSPNSKASLAMSTNNTALGYRALSYIAGGNNNTAIGYNAGSGITTGNNNVILGYNSARSIKTGSNNIVIGNNLLSTYPSGSSNNFVLGSDNNILMSGNLVSKNMIMPEGKLFLTNTSNESLKVQANLIEVIDSGGSNYPDNKLVFKFTGNNSSDLLKLDHNANPVSKTANYQNPTTPRPNAELNGDLRLLGAIRFSDATSVESANFLQDIANLSNNGASTSGALASLTNSFNNLLSAYNNLIIEGIAQENIPAPQNSNTPTTGRIRPKEKVGGVWRDKVVPVGQSPFINIYNRDPFLKINSSDYVIAVKINDEYRPMWVSYNS
jgi:hypothetical protein